MFKKYYKEANEEIVADEVLISKVIANAHKPPVKQNQYIKHVATLAAAVFVVSAAVISMPVWQRVEEEAQITIEEFVENTPSPTVMQSEIFEENTFPVTSPQSLATVIPPENDYESSNTITKKEKHTEQNDDSSSKEVVTPAPIIENFEITETVIAGKAPLPESETKTDKAEETVKSEDNESSTANSVQIQSDSEKESPPNESSDGSGDGPIAGSSSSSSGGGGGGASVGSVSSGAFYDAPNVYIPTPPGFYSTGSGSGYAYFASDSGARITVSYSSCNYSSSPSYSENGDIITANFATGSVAYSIYAVGADMSDVKYIVNSIY